MSETTNKKFEHIFKIYAVILKDDEILVTYHDRGLGAFLGLPAGYIEQDNFPRATIEQAVLRQSSLKVTASNLLNIDYSIFARYLKDGYEVTLLQVDMAFFCTSKSNKEPILLDNTELDDDSIYDVGWAKIDEFMNGISTLERAFWNRSIRVAQDKESIDLVEHNLPDYYA